VCRDKLTCRGVGITTWAIHTLKFNNIVNNWLFLCLITLYIFYLVFFWGGVLSSCLPFFFLFTFIHSRLCRSKFQLVKMFNTGILWNTPHAKGSRHCVTIINLTTSVHGEVFLNLSQTFYFPISMVALSRLVYSSSHTVLQFLRWILIIMASSGMT